MIVGCSGLTLLCVWLGVAGWLDGRRRERDSRKGGEREADIDRIAKHVPDDEDGPYFRVGEKGEYR